MVLPRGECWANDRVGAVLEFEEEDSMADNGYL